MSAAVAQGLVVLVAVLCYSTWVVVVVEWLVVG
jgi:hypothetical protein